MKSLKFNKKIYKKQAVERAVKEFKQLALFEFDGAGHYLKVDFKKISGIEMNENLLADEFSNYVLGLNRI